MKTHFLPCLCINTRSTAGVLTQYYNKTFSKMGITAMQFSLLVNIKIAGSTNITKLTQFVKLDKSTLTRTLTPLIEIGYVNSERGKSKRETILSLTPEGMEIVEKAFPAWQKLQEEIINYLGGEKEAEDFMNKLLKIQSLKELI